MNSILGAKASAILYNIVETAKVNGLRAYDYLKFLLSEPAKHAGGTDRDFLKNLLPWSEFLWYSWLSVYSQNTILHP